MKRAGVDLISRAGVLGLSLLISAFSGRVYALVGGAPIANCWGDQAIVMVIDPRGDLCTGTTIGRDIVLTAAHCLSRQHDNSVKLFQNGEAIGVQRYAIHPLAHPWYSKESIAAAKSTVVRGF